MDREIGVLVLTPWYPTPDFPHRGIFVVDQARALAAAGAHVTVIHADARPFAFRLRSVVRPPRSENGTTVLSATGHAFLPRLESAYAGAAARLTERLLLARPAAPPPDVLHAHVSYPIGAIAVELGQRWQRPVVITEHFGPFSQLIARPLARRRALWALAEANAVVAVSSAQARNLARAGVTRAVEVVPNVVDPAFFAPRPLPPPVPLKVIAVGALVAGKDPETILDAAAHVMAARPALDVRVTFVGSGPLEPVLRRKAAALGLAARVTFTGDLSRVRLAEELAAHHLLAVASRAETFSVAAAEALAAGRPVVATRCGGPEDFVTPEVGELVPIGDPEAMASAWARIADRLPAIDPAHIAHAGAARFAPARVAGELLSLYERCRITTVK